MTQCQYGWAPKKSGCPCTLKNIVENPCFNFKQVLSKEKPQTKYFCTTICYHTHNKESCCNACSKRKITFFAELFKFLLIVWLIDDENKYSRGHLYSILGKYIFTNKSSKRITNLPQIELGMYNLQYKKSFCKHLKS